MWIDRVTPVHGWPGSILTIEGNGFGPGLDDNRVSVGGVRALVLRADTVRLTAMVGEGTPGGPVEVETSGIIGIAPEEFRVLDNPSECTVSETGPPEFFHGPQHGTPALQVADQPVIAIMTYPTDVPPPTAADLAAEQASFRDAARFWAEASYGRTSFDITTTGWLPLPGDWRRYVWDAGDVEWARTRLVTGTRRWTHVAGNRAFVAQGSLGLSIVDLTDRNAPFELGRSPAGNRAFHVETRGNLAYVAAENPGLVVLDVANPSTPVLAGSAGGADPLWSLAINAAGTTLVAAGVWHGLRVYDITNPTSPVLRATVATGTQWATCVRLVGSRAFVGCGTEVRVYDVTNPAAPALLAQQDAGGWVMGLDADASVCAAATDGNGLAVFDVTPAGVLNPAGRYQGVLRLHGVRLAGRIACCAGADQGVHLVDLTTPALPAVRSVRATQGPCYDVAPDGAWALASVGTGHVVPVWFADPAAPALGPLAYLPSWVTDSDRPSLADYRNDVTVASDSQALLKSDQLHVDALRLASANGFDVTTPVGIVVVIAGKFGRGQSGLAGKVAAGVGQEWVFPDTKGVIWLGRDSTWGRKAHEIGHWFGMNDIYAHTFADGTVLRGTAGPWCMSGLTTPGSLFSARQAMQMRLFDGANVVRRDWNPGGGPTSEAFEIVAQGLANDGGPWINLLELHVAQGLSYHVEVRQRPGGAIFDANLPEVRQDRGLVVVTRSREGTMPANTYERFIELFGLAGLGENVVDAARLLRIHVEEKISAEPLAYRVRVHWNEEPPPDPGGKFDLRISPWNEQTWESPDIWINSPRNDTRDPAGTVEERFEFHEPGDDQRPILSGDRPWVKRENTVRARVGNSGINGVDDVYVTAYATSPPGIGDNGNWIPIGTQRVAHIDANAETIVAFPWVPEVDRHTCVSVAVMPKFGEVEPRNNRGQENVARFDSPGASSHQPVILEAMVRSPFTVWRKVDLEVKGLPEGWHAVVDRAWVWVPPKGEVPVTALIWTDLHAPGHEREEIVREAFPRIEGWTTFDDHRYIPIGGILAPVRANQRTRIGTEFSVEGTTAGVYGWLEPRTAGVPVTLEITDAVGARRLVPMGHSDVDGRVFVLAEVERGRSRLQLFGGSTVDAAESESEPFEIDVP